MAGCREPSKGTPFVRPKARRLVKLNSEVEWIVGSRGRVAVSKADGFGRISERGLVNWEGMKFSCREGLVRFATKCLY